MGDSPFAAGVDAARAALSAHVRCGASRDSGVSRVLTDRAHVVLCAEHVPERVPRTSVETRVALLGLLPYVMKPPVQCLVVVAARDDPHIDACVRDILVDPECSVLRRASGRSTAHPVLVANGTWQDYDGSASIVVIKEGTANALVKLADAVRALPHQHVLVVLYGLHPEDSCSWTFVHRASLPGTWSLVCIDRDT